MFQAAASSIAQEYERLGHTMGWRFLASPAHTLVRSSGIAMITLNPGGDRHRPEHSMESCEAGSAYVHESWDPQFPPGEAPLQTQIRSLFSELSERLSPNSIEDHLLDRSLAGYFIPFRSPSLRSLHRRKESTRFSRELWGGLLRRMNHTLFITIDGGTTREMLGLLQPRLGRASEIREKVGWGNVTGSVFRFSHRPDCSLLRLPHLSRFRVFNREESRAPLKVLLDAAVEGHSVADAAV